MEKIYNFEFDGREAIVIVPENANGEWIWKTEFLYAFDQAERALLEEGYTRVYYTVSNRFGSSESIRLMHNFYRYVIREFKLKEKCHLFGFSRGGLYAFNFALFYPEYVASVYLDAPVLDLKSWPPEDSWDQEMLFKEYSLNKETFAQYKGNPVDKLQDFFALNIPLLVVAGAMDELVPLSENSEILLNYCKEHNISVESIIKPTCGHHPHSLEGVKPIVDFVKKYSLCK